MGIKVRRSDLMVISMAREVADGDVVFAGMGQPLVAGAVAKFTHAPGCSVVQESGMIDINIAMAPRSIADYDATEGKYSYSTSLYQTFTQILHSGHADVALLGVGQIDKYGNVNSTFVNADNGREGMRISGSGGAPEFGGWAKKTVLCMQRGEFVEKLDYMSTPGYLGGGNEREETGNFRPGSGPKILTTPYGNFKFDEETKEMYLACLAPGSTVDEIRKKVPWDLKVAEPLEDYPKPTQVEADFLVDMNPAQGLPKEKYVEVMTNFIMDVLTEGAAEAEAAGS